MPRGLACTLTGRLPISTSGGRHSTQRLIQCVVCSIRSPRLFAGADGELRGLRHSATAQKGLSPQACDRSFPTASVSAWRATNPFGQDVAVGLVNVFSPPPRGFGRSAKSRTTEPAHHAELGLTATRAASGESGKPEHLMAEPLRLRAKAVPKDSDANAIMGSQVHSREPHRSVATLRSFALTQSGLQLNRRWYPNTDSRSPCHRYSTSQKRQLCAIVPAHGKWRRLDWSVMLSLATGYGIDRKTSRYARCRQAPSGYYKSSCQYPWATHGNTMTYRDSRSPNSVSPATSMLHF